MTGYPAVLTLMTSAIIKTNGLAYSFNKKEEILHDLHLDVPAGSIYGFLGPNGAGKTTTLKLLLGLLKVRPNPITLFGKEFFPNRLELLRKIGSLIEQPSLYGHLTGKENLEVFRLAYQCEKERTAEVLRITGLAQAANKKTKEYSLGMKQRLAIAIALLHDPELLILDEPTNGLDPTGIIETRDLIIKLNRESGKTVLVSSHLLSEVERIATHVGIIHLGRLRFQGTLAGLQRIKSTHITLEVEVSDIEKARLLLNGAAVKQVGEFTLHVDVEDREAMAALNSTLVKNEVRVYRLEWIHNDLEDIFVDIVST
jgi:ABC-type multidrug transport system ATPase subunit